MGNASPTTKAVSFGEEATGHLLIPNKHREAGVLIWCSDTRDEVDLSTEIARCLVGQGILVLVFRAAAPAPAAAAATPPASAENSQERAKAQAQAAVAELERRGARVVGVIGVNSGAAVALACRLVAHAVVVCGVAPGGLALEHGELGHSGAALASAEVGPAPQAPNPCKALILVPEHEMLPAPTVCGPDAEVQRFPARREAPKAITAWIAQRLSEEARRASAKRHPWSAAELFRRSPLEKDWWPEGKFGRFVNVGLGTWTEARALWKKSTRRRPARPPPVSYDAIVDAFSQPRRTYELPGRMTLPGMVSILNDVWECDGNGTL